jgi:hypothetical protein
MISVNKSLVTFVIVAYNQERFIEEAVKGALAQTYSPLEIIMSDDCSTDQTFAIMQRMAADYKGRHKVVLNRNPSNLGFAVHANLVAHLAQGELIVGAAGDDISLAHRTAMLYDAWEANGKKPCYIHSRMVSIDEQGNEFKHCFWDDRSQQVAEQPILPSRYVATLQPDVFGCTGAFNIKLLETFGDLPLDVIHEDNVLAMRSVLFGQLLFVDVPLVKYRLHGNNMHNSTFHIASTLDSIREQEDQMRRQFKNRACMYRVFCNDLITAKKLGMISEEEFSRAFASASKNERLNSLQLTFMASKTAGKAKTILQLARAGATKRQLGKLFIRMAPMPVFRAGKLLRGKLYSVLR